MSDSNQAPPGEREEDDPPAAAGGAPLVPDAGAPHFAGAADATGGEPAFATADAPVMEGAGDSIVAPPVAPGLSPAARRGLVAWFVVLAVGGIGGIVSGHGDLSAMLALAGLFVAARAADLDSSWYLFHVAVQWTVPVATLATAAGLVGYAHTAEVLTANLTWLTAACAVAALLSLVLLVPALTHRLAAAMFRRTYSTRVTRLAARLVVVSFAMALPLWLMWPDLLRFLVESDRSLADASSLVSGLAGELVLAFAAVGLGLDRGWRESCERLGLGGLRASYLLVAAVGLAALAGLNSGLEVVERRWFPALAAADADAVKWMLRDMSPVLGVVLGICAGVGEEVSIRGALQPRLGLVLSSLVFAALHVQYSWFGVLTVAAIGMCLGLIRARTNTTTAILVHASYDTLLALLAKH